MAGPWEEYGDSAAGEGPWAQYGEGAAAPAPQPKKGAGVIRRIADMTAVPIAQGVVGVPEAAVGMADLVTGGEAGKLAEEAGFRPREARQIIGDELYSDEQKAANQRVAQADGFIDTARAALENPSTVVRTAAESLPGMFAGGAISRLVRGGMGALYTEQQLARMAPAAREAAEAAMPARDVTAGAVGEGVITAGQNAEQVRQESPTGRLTPEQSALLAASGAITGGISRFSGGLAARLGIAEPETALAAGTLRPITAEGAKAAAGKGLARRVGEGFTTEGFLEELPQSLQEQVFQNLAQGKPWNEGVGAAGAMGLLAGGITGGAAAALGHPGEQPQEQPKPPAPLLLTHDPDPLIGYPDGTVARRSEVEAYIASLPPEQRSAGRERMYGIQPGSARSVVTPEDAAGLPPSGAAAAPPAPVGPIARAAMLAPPPEALPQPAPQGGQDESGKGKGETAPTAQGAAPAAAPATPPVNPAGGPISRAAALAQAEQAGATPATGVAAGSNQVAPRETSGFTPQPGDVIVDDHFEAGHGRTATSPVNNRPQPTTGQKEAENYPVGRTRIGGLGISIENAQGSERTGVDQDGKPWKTLMQDHYGRLLGTIGADSTPAKRQHIDAFIVPGTPKDWRGAPVIVDMVDPTTGKFDEHKVVFGAPSVEAARAVIARNYDDGQARIGAATAVPFDTFKQWAYDGTQKSAPFDPSVPTADGGAAAGSAQAGPAAGAAGGLGGAQGAGGAQAGQPAPGNAQPRAAARPVAKGSAGRQAQRRASWEANPFMTFLATHGLFHIKGNPKSLKSEFSPDANIAVPGYHIAMFRRDGMPLDLLLQKAIEEGYLLPEADERQLHDLIARAMRGERIVPQYAEGVIEQEMERLQKEREEAAAALANLDDLELDALIEADHNSDPDLDAPTNISLARAMQILGFTDEEIDHALNAERTQAEADAAAPAARREGGAGAGQAAPRGAAGPAAGREGQTQQQPEVGPDSTAAAPPQGAGSQQASAAPQGASAQPTKASDKQETPPSGGGQRRFTSNREAILDVLAHSWGGERELTAQRVGSIQGDVETAPGSPLGTEKARAILDELVAAGQVEKIGDKYRLPTASGAAASTAPEHAGVQHGVDGRELARITEEFNRAQASMGSGDEQVTHVFDPPAKGEVVRMADRVKVYHAKHGWMTPKQAKARIAQWKAHAQAQGKTSANHDKVVLSFFDLSGQWSQPWRDAGYDVWMFDIQADAEMGDVNNFSTEFFADWFGDFEGRDIYAILAACPCTDFASSGARHFAAKDADGRTVASVKLVHQTLAAIEYFKPAVWAVENPVGRIEKLGGLPPWRLSFDPNAFGEDYTKKTLLWGRFNGELPIAPTEATAGSKMWSQYGGKSLATKNARSETPEGFAYSFFMANNAVDNPVMAVANKYDRLDRSVIEQAIEAGITPKQIDEIVEDHYYIDLDDQAAETALRDAIEERTIQAQPAAPAAGPTATPAPTQQPAPAAAKPKRQRAKSADTLRAEADLSSALADLGDLLGKGTRLNIVPEQEAKLLPILTRVFDAAFRLGYHSFKDAAKFALDTIREKVSPGVADALTLDHMQGAYIAMAGGKQGADNKRTVIDVESKAEIEQHVIDDEEQGDVSGGPSDLERDRSEPAGQPDAGAGVSGAVAGRAGSRAGGRGAAGTRRKGRTSPPDGGPVAGGDRLDQRVDGGGGQAGPASGDARADLDERGDSPGASGVQLEPPAGAAPEDGAERVRSESERRQLQAQVDERVRRGELKVRLGDRASIDETLPYLLPAQREDVHKAELQHAKADGYGMLFTNGTGTGKTFTGLGVIKRRQLLGEVDQFIAVPDNKIAADWIDSAKALGLTITQLSDTKTAGEGIVITTYANLGENDELAKRRWKHVLADEAHSLMQSADGNVTGYLAALRAMTYHPDGQHAAWMMRHREQHNELSSIEEQISANNKILSNPDTMDAMVASVRAENAKLQARSSALAKDLGAKREAIRKEWDANQHAARTRATFLSATPFAYHSSLEWAQGYLFDYAEGYPYDVNGSRPYNQPNPQQYFFMTHLGYRMRTNKLTKPDTAKVDVGMMERQLNSWMKKRGSLSGRMLEVEPDYDRRFVSVDSAIGNRIDEALEYLRERSNEQYQRNREKKLDEQREYGWDALQKRIGDQFDYLSRRYLLEAIKAKEAIPVVKAHMALGRRIVVFHDYKKGSGVNPFDVPEARQPKPADFDKLADPQGEFEKARAKVDGFNAARAQFRANFPELFTELVQLKPPIEAFREAFREGDELLVINGDEKPKDLLRRYAQFQNDDGGPLVALVQSDKNKGWSGHDTTGKFQRALINLGLPTAPTKLIQLEGRIYRTGVVTDAILRSLNTGTNWERWAFANTIASRASTAENLGMGELSRALRDSIIASFENADAFPPGHEGEGKGGKRMDRATNNVLSDFERAKTFYWATGKKTSRNKSEEGKDYFATPEPLGMKMVEWADARGGEDTLEPSAGHGAIARWLPDLSNRTAIEPAPVLMSKLAMAMSPTKDRLIDGTFEDHDIVNKYDVIVMNPPFGVGGKQAIEHVAKANRHLRDGGRIVALIPSGPAADKRLEQFLYGKEERPVKPLTTFTLDGKQTPIFKGDRFESRAAWAPKGVIVDVRGDGVFMVRPDGAAAGMSTAVTAQSITKLEPTGKRTREVSPSDGLQLVADIKLPSVTFERAGTAVWSHIIVLEKTKEDVGPTQRIDLTGVDDINALFDRIEKLGIRPRKKAADDEAPADAPAAVATAQKPSTAAAPQAVAYQGDEPLIEHTTAKGKVIRGIVRTGITRAQAKAIDPYTFAKDGGFFIRQKHLGTEEPETDMFGGPPQPYDTDLFGNAVPQPAPQRQQPALRPRATPRQPALDLEGGDVNAVPQPAAQPVPQPLTKQAELYVDSTLFKAHDRELGAELIRTPEDVAAATRYLARNAVERLDIVVTDKSDRPLAVVGSFKGDRDFSSAPPFAVLAEVLQVPGAANVWMSHNHPSGMAVLSDADMRLANAYRKMLEPTGIRVRGIAAVTQQDGGKFDHYDPHTENRARGAIRSATGAGVTVPVYERELRDERQMPLKITSSQHAQGLAPSFYLRSESPGILLLDTQVQVAGWIPLGPDLMRSLEGRTDTVRRLFELLTRSNARNAILVHGGELLTKFETEDGIKITPFRNLVNAVTRAEIRVLDVIDVKENTSAAARGEKLSGGGELYALDTGSIWRSELEEAISKVTMKQAPAKGWLELIDGLTKRGVKPAEIEWSGVREWLQMLDAGAKQAADIEKAEGADSPFTELWKTGNPAKISKEDVLMFLATNGVRVDEVLRGGASALDQLDRLNVEADALGWDFDRRRFEDGDQYTGRTVALEDRATGHEFEYDGSADMLVPVDQQLDIDAIEEGKILDVARAIYNLALDEQTGEDEDGTRYGQYTLPGGENYRELLITAPMPELTAAQMQAGYTPLAALPEGYETNFDSSQEQGRQWGVTPPGQMHARPWAGRWATPEQARAEALKKVNELRRIEAQEAAVAKRNSKVFQSNHWDEENILAHVRMKDRDAPRADMADIERRIVEAVGAKSAESLGNGAPAVAVRKGAITEQEGRWYAFHRGFQNVPTENPNERVLFIEEIQSDWAQAGRKQGFTTGPATMAQRAAAKAKIIEAEAKAESARSLAALRKGELTAWTDKRDQQRRIAEGHPDEARRRDAIEALQEIELKLSAAAKAHDTAVSQWQLTQLNMRQAQREERELNSPSTVPRGPFVDSTDAWVGLVAKRIIHYAASNGYDRVAFIGGQQSADRYSLSTHVDELTAYRLEDGRYKLSFIAKGGNQQPAKTVEASQLEDYVGRELAAKIAAQGEPVHQYTGLDLVVGGKGMIDFYDKIVPKVLGRLLPKFGGTKLEPSDIVIGRETGGVSGLDVMNRLGVPPAEQGDYWRNLEQDERDELIEQYRNRLTVSKQLAFTVTPQMREAVLQGMPLFRADDERMPSGLTMREVRTRIAEMRGMPIAQAQKIVEGITSGWKGGIEVRVVATPNDLPTSNPNPYTKGYYANGVGYVVAGRHKTAQDIGRTIAHEVIQHHGLRNVLGEANWRRLMAQIQAAANAGNPELQEARDYVRRAYRTADGSYMLREGGTLEADEVAARLIERSVDENGNMRPKLQWLKWVWAKVADFLRSVGFKVPFTMAELHGIWVESRRAIESGRGTHPDLQVAMAARAPQEARQDAAASAGGGAGGAPRTIQVAGRSRPVDNSRGQLIAPDAGRQRAFWDWFGDSKAVDDSGAPLVLFHGTRSDFNEFDGGWGGPRNYFAADASYSEDFADGRGGNIMPVYVRMVAPLDARELGERGITVDQLTSFLAKHNIHPAKAWMDEVRDTAFNGEIDPWWALLNSGNELQSAIEAAGFDGVVQMEHNGRKVTTAYAVFRPGSNVKSATGNNGSFDLGNKDIRFAIDIAGGATREYTPEQMQAMRNVGFAREVPPLKDRMRALWKDAGRRLAQGIVDQFAPIKDISREAYGLLRLSKGAGGAFEVLLHGGQLKLTDGAYDFDEKKRGGVIERLLVPLGGEHHDFFRWVAANRAEQLTREDRERLFTADDIRALKSLASGRLGFDFKLQHGPRAGQTTRDRAEAYADSLQTFNEFNKNTLDMAEQSGLVDPEGRKLWEREFYVPFYRVEDEGGVRGMNIKSGVVRQQAFKHLKGGAQQLNIDLLENTLMNWAHLIDAAAKNRAAKATLEAMQNLGAAIEAREDDVRQMAKSISKRHNVVWFMDAGRQRHFLIDDPYLLAAVSALEFSGFNSPVMRALGTTKRWLTTGVTASPFFKVRNLIRDTVQAIGTAPLGANPLQNMREGAAVVAPGTFSGRNTDEWYRLLAGGGTIHFGTMLEGSEAKRVQALVESGIDQATVLDSAEKVKGFYRRVVEPLVTAYNELGNRGEAINRAALYQQLRRQGVSHADASLQARDLMDFSMQGSFTTVRFLTQVVPFMNARVQGLYKLGRAAQEDPARFAVVLTAVALLSIGLLAAYSDDDDWKKREDWDRNNYWWFKAGGIAYRIPKPFELGALATLAERTWELAFEPEMTNTRFRQQVVAVLGDQLSLNPVPQLVKPIIDVYANVDSFTGRPIETLGMERLQSQLRYREDTSMAARGASTVLSAAGRAVGMEGLSPVQIDHLVRGYFGWLGTLATSAGDVLARPATGQVAQPTPDYWKVITGSMASRLDDAPSRYVSQVYEQAKQLEQIYGTWRYLLREGRIEEAQAFRDEYSQELVRYRQAEMVRRAMTTINALKRRVEESGVTPDEKRERLRELNARADAMARRLVPSPS